MLWEIDGDILTLVAEDLAVKHSFPSVSRAHLLDPLQLMYGFLHPQHYIIDSF